MHKSHFALVLTAALGSVFLAGCESDRNKPLSVSLPGGARPPGKERPLSTAEILARAAAQPPNRLNGNGWQPLFDGRSLAGWRVTPFPGAGTVEGRPGLILVNAGDSFAGLNWTNEIPRANYEVALEAMRVAGSDYFCGLTFPVGDSCCTLIVGGWGGALVGLSSLDDLDASENETTQYIDFETGRWYRVRVRVTEQRVEAWIEQKKVVEAGISGRKVSPPGDLELSKPFGLAAWMTTAALREIQIRQVDGPVSPVQ